MTHVEAKPLRGLEHSARRAREKHDTRVRVISKRDQAVSKSCRGRYKLRHGAMLDKNAFVLDEE
tara:strand:+ start:752 stop:943 length:192 start_codon:yes stop_codon:yes gene_type:complete